MGAAVSAANGMINALKIRCTGTSQPACELSGGNQQKVVFAKALLTSPSIWLCDEPTQAVDVATRQQIHSLLRTQASENKAILYVSSDLTELLEVADEIAVMYLGQLIEKAPTEELFDHPVHPYTRALLSAIPIPEVGIDRPERILLRGEISSPIDPPNECRFAKRCNYTCEKCHSSCPELVEISPGHFVSCHLWKDFI